MEIFELRYFLAVAKIENVNKAAENIHISAGSLSKAISRLEDELQTPLFFKTGRGIRLTPEGLILKRRAAQILQMEEDAKLELIGKEAGSLNVQISSEEILQVAFGPELLKKINKLYPKAKVNFLIRPDGKAIEQVMDGEAHLAIVTSNVPREMPSKVLADVVFQTCASEAHPLFKEYGLKSSIPIEEVLKHPFVIPDTSILGKIDKASTTDGWRDDKYPRYIKYKTCGLKLMENLVQEGMALGYLPDYFVDAAGLMPVKVSGCPYSCKQSVKIVAKDPGALSWLSRLWSAL